MEQEKPDRTARTIQRIAWTFIGIAGAVVLMMILLNATGAWQEPEGWTVRNLSPETLELVAIDFTGQERSLGVLEPGDSYFGERFGGCLEGRVEVRTSDGDLYASEPEQMCNHIQWDIRTPDQ